MCGTDKSAKGVISKLKNLYLPQHWFKKQSNAYTKARTINLQTQVAPMHTQLRTTSHGVQSILKFPLAQTTIHAQFKGPFDRGIYE